MAGCYSIITSATRSRTGCSAWTLPAMSPGAGTTGFPPREPRPSSCMRSKTLASIAFPVPSMCIRAGNRSIGCCRPSLTGSGAWRCSIRPSAWFQSFRWWTRARSIWCAPWVLKWFPRRRSCSTSRPAGRRGSEPDTLKPGGASIPFCEPPSGRSGRPLTRAASLPSTKSRASSPIPSVRRDCMPRMARLSPSTPTAATPTTHRSPSARFRSGKATSC